MSSKAEEQKVIANLALTGLLASRGGCEDLSTLAGLAWDLAERMMEEQQKRLKTETWSISSVRPVADTPSE